LQKNYCNVNIARQLLVSKKNIEILRFLEIFKTDFMLEKLKRGEQSLFFIIQTLIEDIL